MLGGLGPLGFDGSHSTGGVAGNRSVIQSEIEDVGQHGFRRVCCCVAGLISQGLEERTHPSRVVDLCKRETSDS